MRVMPLVLLLAACGGARTPPPSAPTEALAPAAPTAAPASADAPPTPAGASQRLHLALAEDEGVAVTAPASCVVVEGHTFSSTASDLRLHLNASVCPDGGCPRSLVAYLDSPEARATRRGGAVLELRAVGADRAVLVVKNPVLDLAAVVMSDPERRVVVSCSAQSEDDPAVIQTIIDACMQVTLGSRRAAADGEPSAATLALLCHR